MDQLKKFAKYIIWILLLYLFTKIVVFIGMNADYKPMQNNDSLPSCITILKAEATGANGRIYGNIINNQNEDINDKYIKINIYDENYELRGTKYIEINGVGKNYPTKFELHFKSSKIEYYDISIVDKKDENTAKLFEDIFISDDLKQGVLIGTLIYIFFFG